MCPGSTDGSLAPHTTPPPGVRYPVRDDGGCVEETFDLPRAACISHARGNRRAPLVVVVSLHCWMMVSPLRAGLVMDGGGAGWGARLYLTILHHTTLVSAGWWWWSWWGKRGAIEVRQSGFCRAALCCLNREAPAASL